MASTDSIYRAMPVVQALQVLIDARPDGQIVVTNQGSARVWPKLAQHPLDFHYNPSTMGGAIPFALGLAIAQPQRPVLVVSGDGSLLMSLGSLVTVVDARATNLTIVVLDNRMYEVTGGQKTAATAADVDLVGIARSCGFPTALAFRDLSAWRAGAVELVSRCGPRFILLHVEPTPSEFLSGSPPPLDQQLAGLRQALQDRAEKTKGPI